LSGSQLRFKALDLDDVLEIHARFFQYFDDVVPAKLRLVGEGHWTGAVDRERNLPRDIEQAGSRHHLHGMTHCGRRRGNTFRKEHPVHFSPPPMILEVKTEQTTRSKEHQICLASATCASPLHLLAIPEMRSRRPRTASASSPVDFDEERAAGSSSR
jgi:hypothetical protein